MTNETELMPCPFCGLETTVTDKVDEYDNSSVVVGPMVCHSRDGDTSWVKCSCGGSAWSPEKWNTRADAQRVPEVHTIRAALTPAPVDLDALKRDVADLPSVYKIDSVHRAEQYEDRIRVIDHLHQRGMIAGQPVPVVDGLDNALLEIEETIRLGLDEYFMDRDAGRTIVKAARHHADRQARCLSNSAKSERQNSLSLTDEGQGE